MENPSEFFDTPSAEVPAGSPARELVAGSGAGYCQIWRVDRGGRFRVLKCLKPEFRGDPLYERLLLKEFDIGYSLSHGNICEYYSFRSDPGLGNLLEMEWVDGRTLEEFLAEGKRDKGVYDKIVLEICSALSYMHAKQVLHRDLKPSNILVTYNGDNVKLIDFGLSDTDSSSILKTPAGTAVFAAPEVRSGGKASVRSDLYSLGMVMSMFPVRKYSRIVRRLRQSRPEARFASVQEVEKAIKSDMTAIAGVVFILFVAVMALAPVFERWSRPSPSHGNDVILNEVKNLPDISVPASGDTVPSTASSMPQGQPSAAGKDSSGGKGEKDTKSAKDPKPAKDQKATDTALIDELFRQATELFE